MSGQQHEPAGWWCVEDLQACEPPELTVETGVRVYLDTTPDSMGFPRATVVAPTRDAVVGYVRANWGDDDAGWFREWVLDRVYERRTLPHAAAGSSRWLAIDGVSGTSPARRLAQVERAYYDLFKGDLDLGDDPWFGVALWEHARMCADSFSDGRAVDDDEVARRVATAIGILTFGDDDEGKEEA